MAGVFADPVAAGQLLFTPGLLWEAATKDAAAMGKEPAAYLESVRAKIVSFFETEEAGGIPRVVNHETTLAALRELGVGSSKGTIQLLTGPRSVGKTLMLRKVAVELNKDTKRPRRVLLFDARQYGADLTRGIIAHLTTDADPKLLKFALEVAPPSVTAALTFAAKLAAPVLKVEGELVKEGVSGLVDGISKYSRDRLGAEVRLDELLGTFLAACKKAGKAPVIIIDEANHALATTDVATKQRTLDLLQLLTRVAKQHREATVVLATSEHGLPFRLRDLGYNKNHISKVIIGEEVPPAVMKDLLVSTWGCGEHLAAALLTLYGGHVLHASAAVRKLATAADPTKIEGAAAITTIVSGPALCLSDGMLDAACVPDSKRADVSKRVRAAMRALAEHGYVPLDFEADKVAEVISLANVGFVVPRGATAASVPPHAWAARTASGKLAKAILLPSSHIMRLLIAEEIFSSRSAGADQAWHRFLFGLLGAKGTKT